MLSTDAARLADAERDAAVVRNGHVNEAGITSGSPFLATMPAGPADHRLAAGFVVASVLVFVALAPFARTPLTPVPAFIPLYQSALIIGDLATAVMLFGQFGLLRSRAMLVLASAYLFTAFMTVAHTLTFPGLFAPGGLIGAGPQSTAWLYMLWHSGFPILVIAYSSTKGKPPMAQAAGLLVGVAAAAVVIAACALTLLATWGADLLPPIMAAGGYTRWQPIVTTSVWLLTAVALAVLWWRRPHTVLDLWLMVVLCAWLFDIALAAVLNAGRFDLGFYAGRIYGLLAAIFVLIVLLLKSSGLGLQASGAREGVGQTLNRDNAAPRFAYALVAIALLLLLAIAAYTYVAVKRELTDAATARRLAVAQLVAATQSERLDRLTDLAVSLATRVRFAELVAAGEWAAAVQILRGVPAEFAFIDRLAIFDARGTLKADTALEHVSGRNFSERDWYQGLQRSGGRPYVSAMYRRAAAPQTDIFAVAAPIVARDGQRTGILLLLVRIDSFFRWAEEIDFGPGGGVTIVDQRGNEVFRSGAPERAAIVNQSINPVVARMLRGEVGVEVSVDPVDHAEHLHAFVPARHGWGVVTRQPVAHAFAARENQLARLLVGYAVILLLFGATVALATRVAAHRRASERRYRERLRVLHGIDRGVIAGESPETIAAMVIQPLRELLDVPRAIVNRIDLEAGQVEWMAAAGRRRTHVGPGVRYSLELMGDVAALKRGEMQVIDTHRVPAGPDADALLASGVRYYMVVPMIAGRELIGAISFGGERNEFPTEQVHIAREVALQLSIAMVMAKLMAAVKRHASDLESRVLERTAELEAVNKELASFSYSVSHDLRAPLRAVDGYARMLEEDYAARLDEEGRRLLGVVRDSAGRMGQLIDDLLAFSRLSRQPLVRYPVDSRALVEEVIGEVRGDSRASIEVGELQGADGDRAMLKQVWINLIGNALKYSAKRDAPRIEVGSRVEGEEYVYWVRDNGAGFDMRYSAKLFGVFQRLHAQEEFAGTGVGLAIVQRVVTRHGGRVWAEGKPGAGASFFFSLPREAR